MFWARAKKSRSPYREKVRIPRHKVGLLKSGTENLPRAAINWSVDLASDYIHPTPRGGRCRIRLYLPEDEERDAPLVICSELPNNEGSSVTYSAHQIAHQIAAEVIRYQKLSAPVWIEHYPKEATDGHSETFALVEFSSYEVKERAPYLGERRLTIAEPVWRTLDCESVEALVGEDV